MSSSTNKGRSSSDKQENFVIIDVDDDRKPAAKEHPNDEAAKKLENMTANRNSLDGLPLWLRKVQSASERENQIPQSSEENNTTQAGKSATAAVSNGKSTSRPTTAENDLQSNRGVQKDGELRPSLRQGSATASTNLGSHKSKHEIVRTKKRERGSAAFADVSAPVDPKANFANPNFAKRRKCDPERQMAQLEKETRDWHIARHVDRLRNAKVKSFSLKFNDISVAAICKWSAGGSNQIINQSDSEPKAICRPSVDANFRYCSICECWGGHYEIECPKLDRLHTIRFAREIEATTTTNDSEEEHVSVAEEIHGVEIEECDGFLIEQRNVSYSDFRKSCPIPIRRRRRSQPLRSAVDDFVITASRTASGIHSSDPEIIVGDLVFWFPKIEGPETTSVGKAKSLSAGTVIQLNRVSAEALVRFVLSIPPSPTTKTVNDDTTPAGSTCWIPLDQLTLVEGEQPTEVDFETEARRRKAAVKSVVNKRWNQKRRAKRLNVDGTFSPKNAPRLLKNGRYKPPRGRQPLGMDWDEKRGVWTKQRELKNDESNTKSKAE
jgi:hypothetical protein